MKKRLYLIIPVSVMLIGILILLLRTEIWGGTVKYTMYVGLNDKDTYTQLVPTEEAERKVSSIALKHVDGFTAFSAKGAYKDDKGVITNENSLVFEFYSVTEEQMRAVVDEVLKELNQNSVLIEKKKVNSKFYEGAKP